MLPDRRSHRMWLHVHEGGGRAGAQNSEQKQLYSTFIGNSTAIRELFQHTAEQYEMEVEDER